MLKEKHLAMYMDFAHRTAQESYAVRKKVGAVLVTTTGIVLPGYNGTPEGFDNCCEFEDEHGNLVTRDDVLHAESNALAKAGREGIRVEGASMFITLSPCVGCANLMIQNRVAHVYYHEAYRCNRGILRLMDAGIQVLQI